MNFFRKILNNQSGFSIVELTVAGAIGIIALGGAIIVFTGQSDLLKDENDGTKVRAKGRQAIKILAKEIRMAGYGLPPAYVTGEEFVEDAGANKITFKTSKALDGTDATTFTTAAILANATSLSVDSVSGFNSGDNIMIYQTGYFRAKECQVTGTSSATISISTCRVPPDTTTSADFGSLAFDYAVNANLITVSRYNTWEIELIGDRIVKTIDNGNAIILINNLAPAPSGLDFDYSGFNFVGAGVANNSKVGITLNLLDPENLDASIEFKTDVTLRNLGIKG
jgi:hypothetical protein